MSQPPNISHRSPECLNIAGGELNNDSQRVVFLRKLFWAALDTKNRVIFILSITMIVVLSYGSSFTPILFSRFIDEFSTNLSITDFALVLIIGYLLVNWSTAIAQEVLWITVGPIQQRVQRRVNTSIFSHTIRLPFEFHTEKSTGEFLEKLSQSQSGMSQILFSVLTDLLPVSLRTLFILINSIIFLPLFVFNIMIIMIILYSCVLYFGAERIRQHQRRAQKKLVRARGLMTDSLMSIETVKSFDREDLVSHVFDNEMAAAEQYFGRFMWARFTLGASQVTLGLLCIGLAIGIGIVQSSHGALSIGELLLIQVYCSQLMQPLQGLSLQYRNIKSGLTSLDGIAEILVLKPELPVIASENKGSSCIKNEENLDIKLNNVSVYRDDRLIIDSLSMEIKQGQKIAIVGPTGAGKSTIARLLLRLVYPDSGTVLVCNHELSTIPPSEWRELVAFVPQDVILFNDSLLQNLRFAATDASSAEIAEVIRLTRLNNLIEKNIAGLDMVVGERGQLLSGGERQRVGIARALLRKPKIYIFDESTSALDQRTEREILSDLDQLDDNTTRITITHRVKSISNADCIYVMDNGTIAQSGTHADLVQQDGMYQELWKSSAESEKATNSDVARRV